MLFYIAYFLIISASMLNRVVVFTNYVWFVDNVGYLLLIVSFLLYVYKRNIKSILIQSVIFAILFISSHVSKENELFIVFLLIVAFQGMNLRTLIKYDLALKLLFVIIVVTLYFLNLTDNYYLIRSDGQIRSSMGFVHPNTFGAYLLSICLAIYYLNFKKIGILYYIFVILIAFIIHYFADSRTSTNALILLCIMHIIYKVTSGKIFNNRIIKWYLINSFIIFSLVSILLGYSYRFGSTQIQYLDKLFNERIFLLNYFLEKYTITPFGNEIPLILTRELEFTGVRYLQYLDNGFMLLLLRYGLLIFIIAAIFYNKAIKYLFEIKAYNLIIIFFIFLVTGLFEAYFYNIIFNTYILIFSQLITRQASANLTGEPT